MRQARLALLLFGAMLCGGCFQFSSVLTVRGDGSGTIDQRLVFTQAAVAQLRQFASIAGGGQPFDPISEQQAREAAATMGPGVTYVSSTPIETAEGVGRDIQYAFTDVNTLRLNEAPPAPGGFSIGPASADPHVSFSLTHQPDGQALLKILVPQLPMMPGTRGGRGTGNMPSADQMLMLRPMLAGARISMVVQPQGTLVRTSSPYVDGQRVTLVDVAVDALLADDTLMTRLQAARTPADAQSILKAVPGVKVNLDPEITIAFTPR
jgi:hypothetical protein